MTSFRGVRRRGTCAQFHQRSFMVGLWLACWGINLIRADEPPAVERLSRATSQTTRITIGEETALESTPGQGNHRQGDGQSPGGHWGRRVDREENVRRVAFLLDCSLSMQKTAAEERRSRYQLGVESLEKLLIDLPAGTEFVLAGFNESCYLLDARALRLSPRRAREALQFAASLTPSGDTHCDRCLVAVLNRFPRLDAVVVITDARAVNRREGIMQAQRLRHLQAVTGIDVLWQVVDPPPRRELRAFIELTGGKLLVER